LLEISRTAFYYEPVRADESRDIEILTEILKELSEHPFYGYRKMAKALEWMGVTRKQIRRIMKRAGLRAIYPGKNLSKANKAHHKYPYLLKGKEIWLPNQVWAADITYLKLPGGNAYLMAIIDLYSRRILSWKISNTMDTQFCIDAVEEAIAKYGTPAIFNTDQGSQFTSEAFTAVLEKNGIQISMDGVNRALDNIFIERFWRTLKYEDIYIKDYRSMIELQEGISNFMRFYNSQRFHESLKYLTPDEMYHSRFLNQEMKMAS
jgi:putative transposase